MELHCPRCGQTLSQAFYQGKISFSCPEGHGCAVTLSVVRTLCGRPEFANTLWHKARTAGEHLGAPCPLCGNDMSLVRLPVGDQFLELDICCQCQVIWFDPCELEALPKPPPPPPRAEMPQRAREILAMHEIASMEQANPVPETTWGYIAGFLGFPVEKCAPEISRRPWCTWILAAICVVVFSLTIWDLPTYVQEWGMTPISVWDKYGLTILTSMFMHGGICHLLGNMYFLLIFGDNVEDVLGAPKYLLLTLGSGLAANLLHLAIFSHSDVPCVGASGFISGIIAAYAVFFPQVRLCLFFRIWAFLGKWFTLSAWCAFLLWIIFQTIMAFVSTSLEGGGVAYFAHLGGALLGLAVGFLLKKQVQLRLAALD